MKFRCNVVVRIERAEIQTRLNLPAPARAPLAGVTAGGRSRQWQWEFDTCSSRGGYREHAGRFGEHAHQGIASRGAVTSRHARAEHPYLATRPKYADSAAASVDGKIT